MNQSEKRSQRAAGPTSRSAGPPLGGARDGPRRGCVREPGRSKGGGEGSPIMAARRRELRGSSEVKVNIKSDARPCSGSRDVPGRRGTPLDRPGEHGGQLVRAPVPGLWRRLRRAAWPLGDRVVGPWRCGRGCRYHGRLLSPRQDRSLRASERAAVRVPIRKRPPRLSNPGPSAYSVTPGCRVRRSGGE